MSGHEEFNVEENDFTEIDGIESASAMPIGVDGFGADSGNLTYGAGGSVPARNGWMVIVAVIILAVGGLFAMHSLARVTAGSASDVDVDSRIEKFLSQLGSRVTGTEATASQLINDHDKLVKILEDNYSLLQVPLDNVQFNPFSVNRDARPTVNNDGQDDAAHKFRKQREKRHAEIEHACDSIGLKSVMLGKVPLANISGQIVRLGEPLTVDGVDFKVTRITKDRVKLTARDKKYNLVVDVVLELEIYK